MGTPTHIWLIQESAMAGGNSNYNIQHKEADGHRFPYNTKNPNETMIIIYRELADHMHHVTQKETKHSLMSKLTTKSECIMIINVHMPMAWKTITELVDELHRNDEMKGGCAAREATARPPP